MGALFGLLAMACLALPSAGNQFPDIELWSQGTAACKCDPAGVSVVVNWLSGVGGVYSWAQVSGPGTLTFNGPGSVSAPNPNGSSRDITADAPGIYTVQITYTLGTDSDSVTSAPIAFYEIDSISGYVYGETGREIPEMEEFGTPANVIASGHMEFEATVLPSSETGALYYEWSATAGTLTDPAGTGNSYLNVDWDASDIHEGDVTLMLEVKESEFGPTICEETVDLRTIRPYVVGVKFVDDWVWSFPGNEQPIEGDTDPEFDATAGQSSPVCYEMGTDAQVEVDLAGDVSCDDINDLTKKTKVKVTGKLYYDGAEKGDFDEDSVDDGTEDWSTDDYGDVDLDTPDSFPDKVKEFEDFKIRWILKVKDSCGNWVVAYEESSGCGYSHETEHCESTGGKTHGLYLIYDGHQFSDDADFRALTLDYACTWGDGLDSKAPILQAILDAFEADYTYTLSAGNCSALAKDFDHASKALGIESKVHSWSAAGASGWSVGDMFRMYPIPFDPIDTNWSAFQTARGDGSAMGDGWQRHDVVEANGSIYDPTAAKVSTGSWSNYEDTFFAKYNRLTSVFPATATWDLNQSGQSSGCEATGVHVPDCGWLPANANFVGPPTAN